MVDLDASTPVSRKHTTLRFQDVMDDDVVPSPGLSSAGQNAFSRLMSAQSTRSTRSMAGKIADEMAAKVGCCSSASAQPPLAHLIICREQPHPAIHTKINQPIAEPLLSLILSDR
eukprot:scaffold66807_cov51-Prasinocladus_malaysianus.AAC.1